MDWDEEFALQDFLKNELAERNCREQGRRTDRGEEEDGEEKWTVVDTAGEGEARDTSTPLSALSGEAQPGHGAAGGGQGEWGHEGGQNNHQPTVQLLSDNFNFIQRVPLHGLILLYCSNLFVNGFQQIESSKCISGKLGN